MEEKKQGLNFKKTKGHLLIFTQKSQKRDVMSIKCPIKI